MEFKIGMDPKRRILLISLLVAVILVASFSLLTQDVAIIINMGVIALFIVITPVFLYRYVEFLWLKSIEKQFPSFVRDLAGFKKTGMTLSEAVKMSTKNNYGKLSPEVEKFSNRLSWGVPFLRALDIFGNRFKGSKLITEAIGILKESYTSGGNVAIILDSLSHDMMTLKEAEEDRKSVVRQHVMIMYGIFFMFVGISIGIIYVLVPMMSAQELAAAPASPVIFSFADPCEAMPMAFPCGLFEILCTSFDVPAGIACYYVALFLSVLLIQAIFMGLIAGQIGENSTIAGIKHSLIMLATVFVIFMFLAQAGLLPH